MEYNLCSIQGDGSHVCIIKAQEEHSKLLTDIAFESKRYWGYPEEYIKIWQDELTVTAEYISANDVFMALVGGEPAGFCALLERNEKVFLDHLFLKPSFIRKGVGTVLFDFAVRYSMEMGIREFLIFSDPHAEGFYKKMGAVLEKWIESSIKGRMLPVYKYTIL